MTDLRVVVGSGPNSISVTHALLERGLQVLMLDIGETLDNGTATVIERMARQEPAQWSKADKTLIQRVDFKTDPGLPPKRIFGSAFPYYLDPKIDAPERMLLYGSHAFGGLSTLWGCALLKASPGDIGDWPAEVRTGITAAYPQIGALLQREIGADIFAPGTHLKISAAARQVLVRSERNSGGADCADIYPTPLAISGACKACNACAYGCVYGFTYNSRHTIETVFMRNPRFRYAGGVLVEKFREISAGIEIHTTVGPQRRAEVVLAKQLFLAAGMMGTLRILWNSGNDVSRVLHARDSSCILIPGFIRSLPEFGRAEHHGSSHLSVDLKGIPFERKPAHFQLYFNNPAVADAITEKSAALASRPVKALVGLANRFLVAGQGYLHSDFCHRLRLECDSDGTIRVSVEQNPENAKYVDTALVQLTKEMRKLGVIFVKRAASITSYGGSKTAGALPHSAQPNRAATDLLGRPYGAQNVFVVDGTVVPAVPARNHTLTMMANALRIGQAA